MGLHQAQREIVQDNHRFRILVCGRKFGKTTLAGEEITGCSLAKKDRRILYLAPTLDDARRLMWDRLNNKLRGAIAYTNDSRLELKVSTQEGGTSHIFLGSWEKIQNYRGDEFDFIIPDETQDYRNFWTGWHEALRPTLSPRKGSALFMGTPKGFNHLYDLYQTETEDSDYKSFHFTSYDNPFLDPSEIEKAKLELTEDRFAQEYLADFRKMEGLVYKEFDRTRHVYDQKKINKSQTIAGVDFGFTNPACVLEIMRDGDMAYWVQSEWYKTGKTNIEIIEYTKSIKPDVVYPDPAEPDRIEEMKRAGLNARDVNKDIPKGIDAVRELFKQNRLHIHSSCKNLIWELETYAYPDKKDLHNEEERPIKENDHAVDALRYALYMNSAQSTTQQAHQFKPRFLKAA